MGGGGGRDQVSGKGTGVGEELGRGTEEMEEGTEEWTRGAGGKAMRCRLRLFAAELGTETHLKAKGAKKEKERGRRLISTRRRRR